MQSPSSERLSVNQRLFAAGVLEAFESALRRRDVRTMFELLSTARVENTASSAITILKNAR
jgi:hypothetical protein